MKRSRIQSMIRDMDTFNELVEDIVTQYLMVFHHYKFEYVTDVEINSDETITIHVQIYEREGDYDDVVFMSTDYLWNVKLQKPLNKKYKAVLIEKQLSEVLFYPESKFLWPNRTTKIKNEKKKKTQFDVNMLKSLLLKYPKQ